jgi:crotonobetainyl-CoA:carnitine CoA-transferase CaiB-like acyl-CoA transferase
LSEAPELATDSRFATADSRKANDGVLSERLSEIFAAGTAQHWEERLTAADVGCVVLGEAPVDAVLMSESFGRVSGYLCDVEHPTFGDHPRLAPLTRFSRSAVTPGPGTSLGQHTEAVLSELGYSKEMVDELREKGVIG